ncbi:MAG TPA: glycosyltransferase family A protein [Bacteroidales bacterium]|nr:glycosyltransferase family A protein [Bacteroidales bacterium]
MGFSSGYLERKALFGPLIDNKPDTDASIIVVIPAFDEPGICNTLDSLVGCNSPDCAVEVLVIVNAPGAATKAQLAGNRETVRNILGWKKLNANAFFRLFVFNTGKQIHREWGAGMARKTGMDEAVRRFNSINRPSGVIVCLDADCTVSSGYLMSIQKRLYLDKSKKACVIYFEHPLSGTPDPELKDAIMKYELHLRYCYQGTKYTGFPEVFHTVGSTIAVKAGAYVKAGGMNRRQGGEDFYFIQKLIPAGGLFYLNDETVFPSPRVSQRVPFGTGPSVSEILKSEDHILLTYNPGSFDAPRKLFGLIDKLYGSGREDSEAILTGLPLSIRTFLENDGWSSRIAEINANTSSLPSFRKRFYSWFNMFKIVKFLNWAHIEAHYDRVEVVDAASGMLNKTGLGNPATDLESLLGYYRALER